MKTNQLISLITITLGISTCAAFGARLSDGVFNNQRVVTQRSLIQSELKTSQRALKRASIDSEAQVEPRDQVHSKVKAKDTPTERLQALIPNIAEIASLPSLTSDMGEVSRLQAHVTWLKALEHALNTTQVKQQAPRERLISWWSTSYIGFLIGLLLIMGGALIARFESARELSTPATESEALDLGVALTQLNSALASLESQARALTHADAEGRDALRDELQKIQRAQLEPIVEARDRARIRLGLTLYADIFGMIAQGERRLNRAWAALVDAHVPEAHRSLTGALSALHDAERALSAATPSEPDHD